MALNLGELYGTIGIEDRPFQAGIDRAVDYLQNFSGRGVAIAGAAGLAIAGALGVSIFQGMNIEAANDKLAAQLGLTAAESERIGSVAGSLYADAYGDSLEQVNEAVGAVMTSIEGMSTASSAELQDVTARALDFATAFDVDVNRAVQVVGQTVKNGLAGDATEAFDLITAASQKVPTALREDLLDAVDEYGPAFAQLGLSGEDAFAILVDASDKGMYGIDKAGDAVKEFTIRVGTDAARTQPVIEGLGLSYDEMANGILAGGEKGAAATAKIVDGLLSIKDPAAQSQAAVALFGTPLEDLGTDKIPEFLTAMGGGSKSMEDFAGASERMGTTLNDNANTSLTSLKRQAELAFATLGNWALPIVNDLTSAMAVGLGPAVAGLGTILGFLFGAATSAFDFIASHQTTFTIIAGTISFLLIPALISLTIRTAIAAAAMVASWAATAAGAAISAAAQLASHTLLGLAWLRGAAQATAAALRMAAAWLIAMGPIGLVIAAVVGVVVAIVKNWDTIKEKTRAAWDWVVNKVRAVPGLLVGFFMNFTLPGLIIKHFDSIKSGVKNKIDSVVGFLKGLPGRLLDAVGDLGSLLWGVGGDIMAGLGRGIEAGLGWIRGKLSGIGRMIPGWLKSVLGINSPSTVMRDEVGQWIPAGVADGIVAGTPMVEAAAERMAALMVKAPKRGMAPTDMFGGPGGPGASGAGYGGPLVQMDVHPTPGMDEQTVGRSAGDQLQFRLEQMGVS